MCNVASQSKQITQVYSETVFKASRKQNFNVITKATTEQRLSQSATKTTALQKTYCN